MDKDRSPLSKTHDDVPSLAAFPVVMALIVLIVVLVILNNLWHQLYLFILFMILMPLALSLISGLIKGILFRNWDTLQVALMIVRGNFLYENNAGIKQAGYTILSRIFWEQPQTLAANFVMQLLNTMWLVAKANNWNGALVLQVSLFNGSGLALGSYLLIDLAKSPPFELEHIDDRTVPEKILLRHEYGHLLQSRVAGPLYLFKYGIPSLVMQGWTEADADLRSDKKLMKTAQFMPVFTNYRQAPVFKNPRWWEYLLPLIASIAGYYLNSHYGIVGGLFIAAAIITLLNLKRAV